MRAGPLWSLQVEEAGEGGGGMSGLHSLDDAFGSGFRSARGSLKTTINIISHPCCGNGIRQDAYEKQPRKSAVSHTSAIY